MADNCIAGIHKTNTGKEMSIRVFASLFFIFSLAITTIAQSGRQIDPFRSSLSDSEPVSDSAPSFSESVPLKKRSVPRISPVRGSPALNGNDSSISIARANTKITNESEEIIKVETDLVTIPVSVFDRGGSYIRDIRQDEFAIFEDGEQQEVAYFGTTEQPFTVVLLLDTSPSTEYKIEEIRDAAIAFVGQLKPHDRVMVIEFDGKTNVLADLTGDRKTIRKAIKRADFGDGTALYDAVNFTLANKLSQIQGRKAIVLFTDGVDTASSKAGIDSTIALAEESDSMIFPVYYNTLKETSARELDSYGRPAPGTTAKEYEIGRKYLEELSSYTGGRIFQPESTPGGLKMAFEGIAEELRRQYSIGYIPKTDGEPGQRKEIKVRVDRPNLVLRARDSYVVRAN